MGLGFALASVTNVSANLSKHAGAPVTVVIYKVGAIT
jgi:hypothetical protein